jgi:hypothetical protein
MRRCDAVSQLKDLAIAVVVCNLILTIGCVRVTIWLCQWRKRLVAIDVVLKKQTQEIERLLNPAPGKIANSRQVIWQLRQIYQRQLTILERLQQIRLLLGIANTIVRIGRR